MNGMDCAECGMHVEPAGAFHPWLYCWLRKRGVLDPGKFLADHGFMPNPAVYPSQKGSSNGS